MKQILVVDDEETIVILCQKILERAGYTVLTASDGLIALEVVQNNPIDLIVSDLKMPRMDGLTLCKEVKEKWPQIGFILMTGYWMGNEELIQKAKDQLFAVQKKPFEFAEFLQITQSYFKTLGNNETDNKADSK